MNDGGKDRLRQIAEQAGEEERDDENDRRGDQARERGARATAFVHQRLRHAATDWKTLTDARREIRPGESEKFLVAIEAIAMLLGKHPPDRCRLDRSREENTRARAAAVRALRSRPRRAAMAMARRAALRRAAHAQCAPRSKNEAAAMPAITTSKVTGLFGKNFFPRINTARAAAPSASDVPFVSPTWRKKLPPHPRNRRARP